jgi:hypothetical protein
MDTGSNSLSGGEYIVVFRARSSASFLPEEGWEHFFRLSSRAGEQIRTRTFTRWVQEGRHSVPRELVVEVSGRAASIDEAVGRFDPLARAMATIVAYVANVRVGYIEAHLAFGSSPGLAEHPFLEVFLPDESGGIPEGGIIRRHLLEAACPAIMSLIPDAARVTRALQQYELALREWRLGGEWLALSHLWIAVENLTEAVLRRTKWELSKTEEELARMLDVVTDDPSRPRWKQVMREQVREQIIFEGDGDTYRTAKRSSDGLEHGFLDLSDVAQHAIASADATFTYVRRAIIDLVDLPAEIGAELMEIKPKDVQSQRKLIRGRLLGDAGNLALDGELYPRLEWRSSIESVVRSGSAFEMKAREQFTARISPSVQFLPDSISVFGRLAEGQEPAETTEAVDVVHTPGLRSTKLFEAVMPLIEAVTATGNDGAYIWPHSMVFNLFGQGVALYQSARILIDAMQPVEALSSLRGLALIAARFEQMIDSTGPGLGIVLRMALDDIDSFGADPEHSGGARQAISHHAEEVHVEIPASLPSPESTVVLNSLRAEMRFADSASKGGYGAAGLHLKPGGDGSSEFSVQRVPDYFTDMAASACVMALVNLLTHAASLLNWTIDIIAANKLLAEATEINNSAARGGQSATQT